MTPGADALLLTVKEAASLLRIGRNHAYDLIARGELPSIRLGRTIRVPRHRLLAWIDSSSGNGAEGDGVQLVPVAGRGAQHH